MSKYDDWEPLRDDRSPDREKTLGSGGQGTVYLARSPEQATRRRHADSRVRGSLQQITSGHYEATELAADLLELAGPEPITGLGALKKFKIPTDDKAEEARAVGRLESEVKALRALGDFPAVLKLLHANVRERFIVTQYHPQGTLDKRLKLYKGDVLKALQGFRPLVDAVCKIHELGMIHRDIKPENIFVAASGELLLGDFGIVFFQDGSERLTTEYERAGSHYWMAPWVYRDARVEFGKINPGLDIFPLAKVLWSMIAGRNGFPFWELERDENNLSKLFPNDPIMPLVNNLLATRIVREESNCDTSAPALRTHIDSLIDHIKTIRGVRPDGATTWPCRVCGVGKYQTTGRDPFKVTGRTQPSGVVFQPIELTVYLCSHCGNAELFDR